MRPPHRRRFSLSLYSKPFPDIPLWRLWKAVNDWSRGCIVSHPEKSKSRCGKSASGPLAPRAK
jgi:hypothetical protein